MLIPETEKNRSIQIAAWKLQALNKKCRRSWFKVYILVAKQQNNTSVVEINNNGPPLPPAVLRVNSVC